MFNILACHAQLRAIGLTCMFSVVTSAWAEDIPIKVTEKEAYQLMHKAKPIPKTEFYDGWRSPVEIFMFTDFGA